MKLDNGWWNYAENGNNQMEVDYPKAAVAEPLVKNAIQLDEDYLAKLKIQLEEVTKDLKETLSTEQIEDEHQKRKSMHEELLGKIPKETEDGRKLRNIQKGYFVKENQNYAVAKGDRRKLERLQWTISHRITFIKDSIDATKWESDIHP